MYQKMYRKATNCLKFNAISVILLFVLWPISALAQLYIYGGVGEANAWDWQNIADDLQEIENSDNAYTLALGYDIIGGIGAELGYHNFGEYSAQYCLNNICEDASVRADSFSITAVVNSGILFDLISVHAKFGYELPNVNSSLPNNIVNFDSSDTEFHYLVGTGFALGKFRISVNYARHFVGSELDYDPIYSIGIKISSH